MRRKVNLPGNNTITLLCEPTVGYMCWYKSVYLDYYRFGSQRTIRLVMWRWFHFDVIWNENEVNTF